MVGGAGDPAEVEEEDAVHAALRQRCADMEGRISALFGGGAERRRSFTKPAQGERAAPETGAESNAKTSAPPPNKAARTIDDDYGDDDDEEEEAEAPLESPLKAKGKAAMANGSSQHAVRSPVPPIKPPTTRMTSASSADQVKSSEDVRKQLEEDKKAAADTAKRSFQSMFYTLESDHDAMLEQQKLDELDREVENEISGGPNGTPNAQQGPAGATSAPANQGTLGS
ncbi:Transcriptional activator spt7, partial [Teratosphaeriaceae sp. CCFEE 6253]